VYSDVRNLAYELGHRKLSSTAKPKERRIFTTMAQPHYKALLQIALIGFLGEIPCGYVAFGGKLFINKKI